MESVGDAHHGRADDTLNIDSVVLIETLILDGHEGVGHILRNLIHRDRHAVGILRNQLLELIALRIINERRKPAGRSILQFDGGCRIYDALKDPDPSADADNAGGQHEQKQHPGEGEQESAAPASGSGMECFLFPFYTLFAIIHAIKPPLDITFKIIAKPGG